MALMHGASCPGAAPAEVTQVWLPVQEAKPVLEMFEQWHRHPLAELLSCFAVRWVENPDALDCQSFGERRHQRCQLPLLPAEAGQRHIVIRDVATASASPRQMVIASDTRMDVFAHEVAHWLGFVDEYPMSASLAQHYCRGSYDHPSLNVVLTDSVQMSAAELKQLWQRLPWRQAVGDWRLLGELQESGMWRLGSPTGTAVGLYASRTCAALDDVYSWKPVARMTAMEYHDVNYWPEVYLQIADGLDR
ncbi:hypothetical protein CWI71_08405 [Pseudidiomarina insulisalsae]|uniref:Uncharacterized protein n=2 Tax=Pseudidiomarina insulisalsae TaxID=575789 RepID=A0A432YER9_9GAMM|nr:hypothetical protein CWI71_08405 [Pseudidiomarina insulisalsae]